VTNRIAYTLAARDDLQDIFDYISHDNPARARSFLQELRDHCRRIAARPRLYRLREEFGPGVRAAIHGAYLILYTPRDDGLVVIDRIVHGARDLGELVSEGPSHEP
jgi:toxin ParE1/3/4